MNRYHRKLKLTEDYAPKVDFTKWDVDNLKWVEFQKNLKLDELNNEKFVNFLSDLGMTSRWIEVFYTPPGEDGIIHSDNTNYEDWSKIVFQYGAAGSTMRWWSTNKTKEVSTSLEENEGDYDRSYRTNEHYHGQVLIASPEESKIEYESEIGISSLVNVGPLHSSHNPTDDKRFVITVALFDFNKNRIMWDDALERLKDYVV